ncbi:hypothetical protein M409DRAFT_27365 [Zasmidium cellare ATCC 36951]|uniref:Uncharacterized protein n=1 Tax=Zasmidium cellare ATCC 36951 TaxID=1080233 RepID=A0A6A6C816_ZASCE|nr:uncharacterized protein M409DRAFT_27365 [Zasmidium cellare ATCC 36951]KAF2162360.1 hypothetical protein M409DRAFT_27365 [Zasmidium cellare ATCC 36951]
MASLGNLQPYADNHEEEWYEGDTMPKPSSRRRPRDEVQHLNIIARVAVGLLAVWGLISIIEQLYGALAPVYVVREPARTIAPDVYRPDTLEPTLNLCDCGASIAEALQRGCMYDSLAAAWLPAHCRDDDLTAEFDMAGTDPDGSWPYFADGDGKLAINKTQVAALGDGERSFWSTRRWHLAHCVFYWQKYVRMRDTGVVMERRFDSIEHVEHCARLALNEHADPGMLIDVQVVMNSAPGR